MCIPTTRLLERTSLEALVVALRIAREFGHGYNRIIGLFTTLVPICTQPRVTVLHSNSFIAKCN